MIGLKQLAETGTRSRRLNHVHVLLWTVTFGMFLAAALMTMGRPDWKWPLGAFVTTAAVFQILTLGQPPPIAGTLLVTLTFWMLRKGNRVIYNEVRHVRAHAA